MWHLPEDLSVPAMRAAAALLVGEHDFAAFCRRPPSGGTVRRLERLSVRRTGEGIDIGARANAFLHQMVRSLVRMLVDVGRGKVEPAAVAEVVVQAIRDERFLILPHAEVHDFMQRKAADHDRWLAGMRRLQSRIAGGA